MYPVDNVKTNKERTLKATLWDYFYFLASHLLDVKYLDRHNLIKSIKDTIHNSSFWWNAKSIRSVTICQGHGKVYRVTLIWQLLSTMIRQIWQNILWPLTMFTTTYSETRQNLLSIALSLQYYISIPFGRSWRTKIHPAVVIVSRMNC